MWGIINNCICAAQVLEFLANPKQGNPYIFVIVKKFSVSFYILKVEFKCEVDAPLFKMPTNHICIPPKFLWDPRIPLFPPAIECENVIWKSVPRIVDAYPQSSNQPLQPTQCNHLLLLLKQKEGLRLSSFEQHAYISILSGLLLSFSWYNGNLIYGGTLGMNDMLTEVSLVGGRQDLLLVWTQSSTVNEFPVNVFFVLILLKMLYQFLKWIFCNYFAFVPSLPLA